MAKENTITIGISRQAHMRLLARQAYIRTRRNGGRQTSFSEVIEQLLDVAEQHDAPAGQQAVS